MLLPIPSRPYESISMDFVGGFPMFRRSHDYLFVVVEQFSKMYVHIPCHKTITNHETNKLFFENV
jgi:hypothetical protein